MSPASVTMRRHPALASCATPLSHLHSLPGTCTCEHYHPVAFITPSMFVVVPWSCALCQMGAETLELSLRSSHQCVASQRCLPRKQQTVCAEQCHWTNPCGHFQSWLITQQRPSIALCGSYFDGKPARCAPLCVCVYACVRPNGSSHKDGMFDHACQARCHVGQAT